MYCVDNSISELKFTQVIFRVTVTVKVSRSIQLSVTEIIVMQALTAIAGLLVSYVGFQTRSQGDVVLEMR